MKYIPRPHQTEMLDEIDAEIEFGGTKIMVDSCPAFGKSLLMAEIARKYQEDGVIILINITALLDQLAEHLSEQKVEFSILKADRPKDFDRSCKVQLVMSQTLHARIKKSGDIFDHKFKIYQQDEGHRENSSVSKRTKDNIDFLNPNVEIAYSGTPYDSDGFKFNNYEYLNTAHAIDLQNQGYLCPIKYYIPKWAENIDFSKISKSSADYSTVELDKIINTDEHLLLALNSMNDLNAKQKKTLVFCSGIEQADKFTRLLKSHGYSAEAFHSKSDHSERIMHAFKHNTTFNKSEKNSQASLFKGNEPEEFEVKCLVSINKIGIGFDSPDAILAVQLRPTKVRSLFVQQVMRVARIHESKQFAEYLDLGQTTSSFGFHTDLYSPPSKTNDRKQNAKLLEEANIFALDDIKAILSKDIEEMDRSKYTVKVAEVKKTLERPLESLTIIELARAFEIAKDHKEIIKIATLIYTYKFGDPVSKKGFTYKYRPESFWGTSTFGDNEDFHVHHTMQEYFDMVPEKKTMWIKALRTFSRNIIKTGKGLYRITGFIKFLYKKHLEDSINYIDDFKKYNSDTINLEENQEIPF